MVGDHVPVSVDDSAIVLDVEKGELTVRLDARSEQQTF
jgi:hypothetical protein